MLKGKVKVSIDVEGVMKRIERKRNRVLYKTGGYGLTIMRRSIRPPKRGKRARTVAVNGQELLVPVFGKVVDRRTGKPVDKQTADAARRAMAQRLRAEGAGQPPRRGPSDLLRQGMHFAVDESSESVVIGPKPFARQSQLVGAVSVPELLNKGGGQIVAGSLVKYAARPFVEPALGKTFQRMAELTEKVPL